jgi:hypothetical protein
MKEDCDEKRNSEIDGSKELTPQWIQDQRQKAIERERNMGRVDMASVVSASASPDPSARKKSSKADVDRKPSSKTTKAGETYNKEGISSYWEAHFRRESLLNSDDVGAISDDCSTEKAEDIKDRAQATTKPQSLDERRPTFDGKSVKQKNQTSRDSHLKKSSQEEATQGEGETRLTPTLPAFGCQTKSASHECVPDVALPGAFAQAGPGIDEEPIEEVLASCELPYHPSNTLRSLANAAGMSQEDSAEASIIRATTRNDRRHSSISDNSASSSRSSSLVNANLVSDAETIFYAEEVQHANSKRRSTLAVIIAVTLCVLALALFFSLDGDPCRYDDERCCVPREELQLPDQIPLMCHCFNTTEGIYDNFTDVNLGVYTFMKNYAVRLGIMDAETMDSLDPNGCLIEIQLLLTIALTDRWGVDYVDFLEAPASVISNVFALGYMFISMSGIDWHQNEGWYKSVDICNWFGVDCLFLETLSEVLLPENGLTGTLPTEIQFLESLRHLDLSGNLNVTGSIPSEFGGITTLNTLDLSEMSLEGSIPASFSSLDQLGHLALINSQLTGTLPTELFQLQNIRYLALSGNHFHGTIPTEVGQSTSLNILRLDRNELVGSLPAAIENLTSLELLNIGENNLEGPVPDILGQLPRLQMINLFNSGLTGTIPETFCVGQRQTQRQTIIVNCSTIAPLCSCCGKGFRVLVQLQCGEDIPERAIGN